MRPKKGLVLKGTHVVLQVLAINQESLQAIGFRNKNVTRGFLLAGGGRESSASTPGMSV